MSKNSKSLWLKLAEFPPIVCRLLARTVEQHGHVRPLTTLEISKRSGLTPNQIVFISTQSSWNEVPYKYIRAFVEGCNIYLDNRANYRTHASYVMRDPSWNYLRTSPDWKTVYEPLIRRYLSL